MEFSGVILHPISSVSGCRFNSIDTGKRLTSDLWILSSRDSKISPRATRRYLQYYISPRCGKKQERLKEKESNTVKMEKKLKLIKNLSKNLSRFSEMNLEIDKGKLVSETAEMLQVKLQELKTEEKDRKRKRNTEDTHVIADQTQRDIISEQGSLPKEEEKVDEIEEQGKIEVCMGGKCKKSRGEELLEEFQRKAVGVVVGCKCTGKCRDGPNVRLSSSKLCSNNRSSSVEEEGLKSATTINGVGLEDVGVIVAKCFGDKRNNQILVMTS